MVFLLLLACGRDVPTPPVPRANPTRRWEKVLREVVDDEGMVNYHALAERRAVLEDYVGWVAVHGPETDQFRLLDDDRRLAWHINTYNALVLYGVLLAAPIGSVRDVSAPLGGPGTGFFGWWRFGVDGERTNLYWYERGVILDTYNEPLVHAALNCASRSCPPLLDELYREKDLQKQLERQMRRWLAGGAASWDGEMFVFSSIFDWYADDFRNWAGAESPCTAVRGYVGEPLAGLLDGHPDCPHRFAPYDWSLNTSVAR